MNDRKSQSQSLHFSDGIIEFNDQDKKEYSEITSSNNVLLRFIDWFGEKLAWSLGISSPKYYYIIENTLSSQQNVIGLGDLDDPHVAILQFMIYRTHVVRRPILLKKSEVAKK
ncbi:unnamed protein product [Heterobilharzia americana]|nr:unnamed protein product [Heterobilharzia americana]